MPESGKTWTVYIAHQANIVGTPSPNWGLPRKWTTFDVKKKVRMDSPPEFTATIEYDPNVTFNDLIQFVRDGNQEWVGFVEDIEIDWDEDGRFLNLGGRDLTLLLWRKYVENFNNPLPETEGFFGNINPVELMKFLLWTPRSDLPQVPSDTSTTAESMYPYNKEGWGIDISNFIALEGGRGPDNQEGYGDINTTVLRKRDMIWSNSGTPFEISQPTDEYHGYEGVVGAVMQNSGWDEIGTAPYANDSIPLGTRPTSYIQSNINVNASITFSVNPLWENPNGKPMPPYASPDNATAVNSCTLVIWSAGDFTLNPFIQSDCEVLVYTASNGDWSDMGEMIGRSNALASLTFGSIYDINKLAWRIYTIDLSHVLTNVGDVNNARIKFVELGLLSTYIRYCYLQVGYASGGTIYPNPTKTSGHNPDWVNIQFNEIPCMGVYLESREHINSFPAAYHITTSGGLELFNGYTLYEASTPNPPYLALDAGQDQLTFYSYQSDNSSKIAYFYRQGINATETGPINGTINESFAFNIGTSQPCSTSTSPHNAPAFIPWCLANQIANFYTIEQEAGAFTTFDIINIGGVLYPEVRYKGSSYGTETYFAGTFVNGISNLSIGTTYWVQVIRSGTTLTYYIYNAGTMKQSELIWSCPITNAGDTFTYRYMAISYAFEGLAEIYSNNMDAFTSGGQQFINGGFETGDSTGWLLSNAEIYNDGTNAHSGIWDLYMPCTESSFNVPEECTATQSANFNPSVVYNNCTSLGFWHRGQVQGKRFQYYLVYSDNTLSPIVIVSTQTGWIFEDAKANAWTNNTKQVVNIFIDTASFDGYGVWIDDFTAQSSTANTWSTFGGNAQDSTNTTQQIQGTGCQQIQCTANGQKWYFEEDINPTSFVQVDAWVRAPPPHNQSKNGNVMAATWNQAGSNHWLTAGTAPYVRTSSDEDDNHIYVLGTVVPTWASADYCTFDNLANAFSTNGTACVPTSPCHFNVSARIQNNIGGNGAIQNIRVQAFLWVAHSGSWVQVADSGNQFSSTSWANLFAPTDISSYLTSYDDWMSAQVKFSIVGSIETSGNPAYAQFQIGQVLLNFNGTLSYGWINLLKLYNSSSVARPNPNMTSCAAVVGVETSLYANSNQQYMRFFLMENGNLVLNGEWGTSWTDFPIINGTWIQIRLIASLSAGSGYVQLYNITSGTPVLLAQFTSLNNAGTIDTVDFEAEYDPNLQVYGSGSTYATFLDAMDINTQSETYTLGVISAGLGPEITLVNTYQPITLASNASKGSSTIVLSSAPNAFFQPSMNIGIMDTFDPNGNPTNCEINVIESVNGNTITLQNPLVHSYTTANQAMCHLQNIYPDILHSWHPRNMTNVKIYADPAAGLGTSISESKSDNYNHGWEITQTYIYRTDPVKYWVRWDEALLPNNVTDPSAVQKTKEYKIEFTETGTAEEYTATYAQVNAGETILTTSQGNVKFYNNFSLILDTSTLQDTNTTDLVKVIFANGSLTQEWFEIDLNSYTGTWIVYFWGISSNGIVGVYSNLSGTYSQTITVSFIQGTYGLLIIEGDNSITPISTGNIIPFNGSGIPTSPYPTETTFTNPIDHMYVSSAYASFIEGNFNIDYSQTYSPTVNTDLGLQVYANSFAPQNFIGILIDDGQNNYVDIGTYESPFYVYEWRVDATNGVYAPKQNDVILLYTPDGGDGVGNGICYAYIGPVYSGGPYIYLADADIDLNLISYSEQTGNPSGYTQGDLFMIGPTNIPKNRLMDILFDIGTMVNDDYLPFEWWIESPSVHDPLNCIGDFHMGPRVGSDKSTSVSFVTGTNMQSVKYQRTSRDTYQRVQVIGSGEGKNQEDSSSIWSNDSEAMDEIQGFFEDIFTQKQVAGGRIADRYAKVRLKIDASPKRKNAITCKIGRDTYEHGFNSSNPNIYDVGDDVVLNDVLSGLVPNAIPNNLTSAYRIWNTEAKVDENGENITLTCQAPYLDISNVWKDVYKQLKTLGIMGVIATDWAAEGAQSNKVNPDKLSTLFSKTAKNEEVTTGQGSSDPQWFPQTNGPSGYSPSNDAGWKADTSNCAIWGGDKTNIGIVWQEARYSNKCFDAGGNNLQGQATDIPLTQEPKFTTTFEVYEPANPPYSKSGSSGTIWNIGDYIDVGMMSNPSSGVNTANGESAYLGYGTGFFFRIVCVAKGEFYVYACFSAQASDYYTGAPYGEGGYNEALYVPVSTMITNGKAKFMCGILSNTHYKATIQVEFNGVQYGNALPEVLFTIANTDINNPPVYSAVYTSFNTPNQQGTSQYLSSITVRPIYILASGSHPTPDNPPYYRCVAHFFNIKCQRNVLSDGNT